MSLRHIVAQALRTASPAMEDIARSVGLTSAALRQYRLGARTPSSDVIQRLARTLRTQAGRLLAIARRLERVHSSRGGDDHA
jgi:transcriptional regulator with XRE-family HTH domain